MEILVIPKHTILPSDLWTPYPLHTVNACEILHHLGWLKPYESCDVTIYQLGISLAHPQYQSYGGNPKMEENPQIAWSVLENPTKNG